MQHLRYPPARMSSTHPLRGGDEINSYPRSPGDRFPGFAETNGNLGPFRLPNCNYAIQTPYDGHAWPKGVPIGSDSGHIKTGL